MLKYCHNLLGLHKYYVAAEQPLGAGRQLVEYKFEIDPEPANMPGRGGLGTLFVNGAPARQGRIPATVPVQFWLDNPGCGM